VCLFFVTNDLIHILYPTSHLITANFVNTIFVSDHQITLRNINTFTGDRRSYKAQTFTGSKFLHNFLLFVGM